MNNSDDEEMRYCAECGDPEFDKKGEPTHDYEPYDHDFEPEEDDLTTQDIKEGLNILGKGLDVWNKYKKAIQPISQKNLANIPDIELHSKIDELKHGIEKGKKIERRRWIIGIAIGGIITVIAVILQFLF